MLTALSALAGAWIPLTLIAALSQTVRNASQRHLIGKLGTLGATLVRFLYGMPFAMLWLGVVTVVNQEPLPTPNLAFIGWVTGAALSQVLATAVLLRVMSDRNFTIGVAYSKTELLQVAIFSVVVLGDPLSVGTVLAVVIATLAVLMLSPASQHPVRTILLGWTHRTALLGILSGAGFAVASVCYRGGALALAPASAFSAGAACVVVAQIIQTLVLAAWLWARHREALVRVLRAWRVSLLAGAAGAIASIAWTTAGALEPVAHVRTFGLIELLFAYLISRRLFSDTIRPIEAAALVLLTLSLAIVSLWG